MASIAESSSSGPSSSSSSKPRISAKSTADPILRNALRYTISAKEYETLHKYIISRSKVLRRNAPTVAKVEKLVKKDGAGGGGGGDDYNAAAIRASLRVFLASSAALKVWELVGERWLGRVRGKKVPFYKNANLRLSISSSSILLLHRLLFRFFTRLRAHLLTPEARPFRQRNKRTSKTLTSSLAPAVGASMAGFMLAVYPADQLRVTIAIYALSRAAEFAYNLAEEEGWIWNKVERPWWWGSWLLFPITSGQLLHAFVFDRDCFPKGYGDFILKYSQQYIAQKPEDYPASLPWPDQYEIVDNLAEMARLNYPPFTSPILFPNTQTLPASLSSINPITAPAHPLLKSLTCATLHPSDPSCTRTYLSSYLTSFPPLARLFTIIFTILSLPSHAHFYSSPLTSLNNLASTILRYSLFVSGSISTSWAAICFFQAFLPRHVLSTQRFFLGGFLGGIWGFVVRKLARGEFLYAIRASLDSLWKVGRKRGWWKGVRGGDVWIFVVCLGVINSVYERDGRGRAIQSRVVRKGVSFLRGDGEEERRVREEKRVEGEKGGVLIDGKE
ncbi:uncharacterized protein LY89DRAFT_716060 [Mollisia scopiformis]|uniref:Transmembrane protein 135 N-terminal domain-containing protein n=1 Tax=Mollisia scopiformis TaxID=149040 RepID=A0A194XLT0_MOLSC|nr:uncharacterized protein LY89DRAFT_716060 [Mollisia scopiformis]KUJ20722.1 hypothetical protein LY89DRAFT_716060 [Mollisia scopiformis]